MGVYYYYYYYCPTRLETVGLCVPNRNFRELSCLMLSVNVEPVLALDSLLRHMPLGVLLLYSMEV